MSIRHVLTVCLGNICRSPMAEGLLAAAMPDCEVASAGLGALSGHPADPIAQALMQERGLTSVRTAPVRSTATCASVPT